MTGNLFSLSTLYLLILIAFVTTAITKVGDFYGVHPDVYMTYMYFYFILVIAYLILPHGIPDL